jgi:glycosyltransferase involved in cell wall biosynthesis
MKIALVHDYLNQFGGAERVVGALHDIFPQAPLYTSIADKKKLPDNFRLMDIRTSFMQNLPLVLPLFRYYLYFYPFAFESFDLSDYEVIFSSSSAFAKGVRKKPGQLHICYCHTPMRFVWRYGDYVKKENFPIWLKWALPYLLDPLRRWDLENSRGVDYFIANSQTVARRIEKIYGRESVIINPPVDGGYFDISPTDGDYFLLVSRLNPYKRIDVVVEAFNRAELPLKIIGSGPAEKSLKRQARDNIEFLGRVSDRKLRELLSACRALIFPGEEDFGIAPLEAMACGRPVLAYKAGGALETVREGETGIFFKRQDPAELEAALRRFRFELFSKQKIRAHALKFDLKEFRKKIAAFVKEKYEKKQRKN